MTPSRIDNNTHCNASKKCISEGVEMAHHWAPQSDSLGHDYLLEHEMLA
jgi:hypothetical protein